MENSKCKYSSNKPWNNDGTYFILNEVKFPGRSCKSVRNSDKRPAAIPIYYLYDVQRIQMHLIHSQSVEIKHSFMYRNTSNYLSWPNYKKRYIGQQTTY